MKKKICILLVLATLLSLTACTGESSNNTPSTSVSDTTSAPDASTPTLVFEDDDLPDNLDFGGITINILSQDLSKERNSLPEITTEELTSEVINDSIYNREKFVEDRLNIEIKNPQTTIVREEIDKQLNSGEDYYQIHAVDGMSLARVSMKNYFVNLYDLEYIDFKKPWWSSLFNEEAEVFDTLYLTTGALSLSLFREMYVVYYNKALAEDYAASTPELSNVYSIVDQGKWTIDKLTELGGGIYRDLNGNSQRDIEDLYGIGYVKSIPCDAIWGSFDINVFSKTNDGWFELDVNTEKLYTVLEKMNNLFYNVDGCFAPHTDVCTLDNMNTLFASGTILFMVNKMESVEKDTLRNMQDEYGILPYPKYDENQKEYYSCASDAPTSFAIPTTNTSPEIAGAVLEALASYSYRDTYPAYLDTALKGKYMSDPESRKMIDLVVDGYKLDASWVYFDTLAQEYPARYRYMLIENDTEYASAHASKSKAVERVLKIYKAQFQANS